MYIQYMYGNVVCTYMTDFLKLAVVQGLLQYFTLWMLCMRPLDILLYE